MMITDVPKETSMRGRNTDPRVSISQHTAVSVDSFYEAGQQLDVWWMQYIIIYIYTYTCIYIYIHIIV